MTCVTAAVDRIVDGASRFRVGNDCLAEVAQAGGVFITGVLVTGAIRSRRS